MQVLKLESFEIEVGEKKITAPTKEWVHACVVNIPNGGIGVEDQRKRLRILDALDKSEEVLELEDADAAELKSLVSAMKWVIVNKHVVKFCDDVANMKAPVEPNA
jgi:hypothetical protein